MESGTIRHRRGAKYKRPLLRDPWAVRGRDVLVMSLLWGLLMGGMTAAALGVICMWLRDGNVWRWRWPRRRRR